jgi:phosphomevalonate kinase
LIVRTKAPGKLILLGEYALLEGAPGIVCAINRFAHVSIKFAPDSFFVLDSPSLNLSGVRFTAHKNGKVKFITFLKEAEIKQLKLFKSIFEFLWKELKSIGFEIDPVQISINTNNFYSLEFKSKLGFGSSAAMTVALTAAFSCFAGRQIKGEEGRSEVFERAFKAHRLAQENLGSGIDVAASSFAGTLSYKMTADTEGEPSIPESLEDWPELSMSVMWTGKSTSTSEMIKSVTMFKNAQPKTYDRLMINLTNLSKAGISCYREKDSAGFIKIVKQYFQALRSLGKKASISIISPVHERLALIVESLGGAYKPSGAGDGDIGIAFAHSVAQMKKIENKIVRENFKILPVQIENHGFMFLKNV